MVVTKVAFILVILITMRQGEDLKSFEIILQKESERPKYAETYQFPLPIISIETRYQPVIGNTQWTQVLT